MNEYVLLLLGYKNEYRQLYSYSSYYAVHFEKGGKAAQSFPYLNELFDEGIISECRCRELFARFKSSETSLEDKPGRGRPSYFDDQVLLADIERDESLTTRMLFDNFNVDHSTIVRSLKKLGKVWKLAGWVPHELRDNNKAKCLRIFTDLLQQNERKAELSIGKPSLTGFVIGGTATMRSTVADFRQKRQAAIQHQHRCLSDSTLPPSRCAEKTAQKEPYGLPPRTRMLSVVLLNASPIRAANCFHIRPYSSKEKRTGYHANRLLKLLQVKKVFDDFDT
ncbi:Histone-lysine N-methyltransferase SETMAR like protein [Argiope bruennichi]|uniref:Histone-lysine N-methyltransferase SETMAR like protein n=1 Tax=Argiope bruennichi TaxID=94029 RepID=A0A8T0ETW6_ARGBR|nr:Histone-lysine N-methyltransferase SETMAR like protein [Argiope bruennichi]